MSRIDRRVTAAAIFALVAPACVARSTSGSGSSRQAIATSPRLVTQHDLRPLGTLPLDDALRRVRPELLQFRGQAVNVYVDGQPSSQIDLHYLRADIVAKVRLLSPVEARMEYGPILGIGPILDVRLHSPR